MKFNVGDIVEIRNNLEVNDELDIIDEMIKYSGMVARIVEIDCGKYILDLDLLYTWNDESLKLVDVYFINDLKCEIKFLKYAIDEKEKTIRNLIKKMNK